MRPRRTVVCSLLVVLAAWPACAVAGDAAKIAEELKPFHGTCWYGVYFQGQQKCGFAKMVLEKKARGNEDVYEVRFAMAMNVTMGGAVQKLVIGQKHHYKLTGELIGLESVTDSAVLGKSEMAGVVKGTKLLLSTTMAGRTTTTEMPAPDESLDTILAGLRLVRSGKIGGTADFEMFEPTLNKTIKVATKLVRFENRLIGGVKTKIGVLETTFGDLGMGSTDYVTTDGNLLETVVGGLFTLRREPEKIAKDVKVAFDALRAGIIPVKEDLGDPRDVRTLKLKLSGIEAKGVLMEDDRQSYDRAGQGPDGEGKEAVHSVTLTAAEAPAKALLLPMKLDPKDEEIAQWLRPSTFTQSDAPEIIAAAKKIVGNTTDSYKAACKIQAWVYKNVDKVGVAAMSNALGVLKKMKGDCSEHSVLFVALCRAAGIPAREVVGIGYSHEMKGFGYHAWAEVYVGKWVAMDPTWGEDLADATHVKFGVGDSDAVGSIGGLFGALKVQVLDFKNAGD